MSLLRSLYHYIYYLVNVETHDCSLSLHIEWLTALSVIFPPLVQVDVRRYLLHLAVTDITTTTHRNSNNLWPT